MRLINLTLKNVYCFADYSFDYRPGVTGIIGSVGSGKSGFGEVAQYFAVTGKIPAIIPKKDELLSWGAVKGWTDLTFEHDGIEYLLRRHVHNSSIKLSWTENGMVQKAKQADAAKLVEDMLGMAPEVFYECCFVRQGNLWAILLMTTTERLAYFQRITGTIIAEKLRASLQKAIGNLPQFPDRSAEIAECKSVIQQNESAHKAVTDQQTGYKVKLDADPENLEEVVGKLTGVVTEGAYKKGCTDAQWLLDAATKHLKELEDAAAVKCGERKEQVAPPTVEQTRFYDAWLSQWCPVSVNVQSNKERKAAMEKELAAIDVDKIETAEAEGRKRKEVMITKSGKLSQEQEDLREDLARAEQGKCPTCGQDYPEPQDPAAIEKKIHEVFQKNEEARALIKELDSYISTVVDQKRTAEARIRNLGDDIVSLTKDIELAETEAYVKYDSKPYLKLVEESDAYTAWFTMYQKYERDIAAAKNTVTEKETDLKVAEAREYTTMAEIARLEKVRSTLTELHNLARGCDGRLAEISAVIKSQGAMLEVYEKDMAKQAKTMEQRELLEKSRELLHRQHLPKIVMSHLRVSLAYEVQQQLYQFDMPYRAELNSDFDYVIHWPAKGEKDKGIHTLSGGQKVILSICHHLALAKILANSIPLIFLDEPTNHLGDSEKSLVQQALYAMREHAGRNTPILVSTHEEQLYPAFGAIVKFYKNDDEV